MNELQVKFSVDKYQVMQTGGKKLNDLYILQGFKLSESTRKQDLASSTMTSSQCAAAVKKEQNKTLPKKLKMCKGKKKSWRVAQQML